MTIDKRIFPLRLASAIGGAAIFGLLSAPLLPFPWLPSAFLLAFCFGFVFVGGTGYRILLAVARLDKAKPAAASWSGAIAISAVAAMLAWATLGLRGIDGAILLAAYAAAINAAYVPVKFACLSAGCCTASRPVPALWPGTVSPDLRRVEIAATLGVFAATIACIAMSSPQLAATIGLFGHLSVRVLSRWSRKRLPDRLTMAEGVGVELIPLALATLISVGELLS